MCYGLFSAYKLLGGRGSVSLACHCVLSTYHNVWHIVGAQLSLLDLKYLLTNNWPGVRVGILKL